MYLHIFNFEGLKIYRAFNPPVISKKEYIPTYILLPKSGILFIKAVIDEKNIITEPTYRAVFKPDTIESVKLLSQNLSFAFFLS